MVIQCSSGSESFVLIFFAYADNFPVHSLCHGRLDQVAYQIYEGDLNPWERGALGEEELICLTITFKF